MRILFIVRDEMITYKMKRDGKTFSLKLQSEGIYEIAVKHKSFVRPLFEKLKEIETNINGTEYKDAQEVGYSVIEQAKRIGIKSDEVQVIM